MENDRDVNCELYPIGYLGYLADWLSVSYNLCLDIIVPLHREMGLVMPNSEILPQVFRDGVLGIERKGRIDELIITDFKNKIRNYFGLEGLRYFLAWFFTVYRSAPGWTEWRSAWRLLDNGDHYESLKTMSNINNDQINLLKEYEKHCFFWEGRSEDFTVKLLKELRRKELSYWDSKFMKEKNLTTEDMRIDIDMILKLIERGEFKEKELSFEVKDNIEVAGEVTDVFLDANKTISMNRFQIGWEQLWGNFTVREKCNITIFGEKCLNSIRGKRDKRFLPHPDTLIRYF